MRFELRPESIFFIGIAGGRCADKSAFAQRLREALGLEYCRILYQDAYYMDQNDEWDDPCSIDFALFYEHLLQLQNNEVIAVPIYDFSARRRLPRHERLFPADIILLEGTLILAQPRIRELLSASIFIDVSEAIRLERWLQRGVIEESHAGEGIVERFYDRVKPMHDRFIEPTKVFATHRIFDEQSAEAAITDLVDRLGIDS
jgi:uridine kinase